MMRYLTIIISLLILACHKPGDQNQESSRSFCLDENFKNEVEFYTASLKPVTEGINLTGSVEADPDQEVAYVALVDGTIVSTFFNLGDKVKKGQVLAELKSSGFSEISSGLSGINSRIKAAELAVEKAKSLLEDGLISNQELAEALSELEILKSEKSRLEKDLELYGGSTAKGVFQIRSPLSGVITEKNINSGSQVFSGGDALFKVSNLARIRVMINIYATNIQKINSGMEVFISTLAYPDEQFKGVISQISPVFDEEARVLKAKVILPNPDYRLKPGMPVDVMAYQYGQEEKVSVPSDAVVFSDNQNFVLVYRNDCDIQARKVELDGKFENLAFVKQGLSSGEKIISKNQLLIFEAL